MTLYLQVWTVLIRNAFASQTCKKTKTENHRLRSVKSGTLLRVLHFRMFKLLNKADTKPSLTCILILNVVWSGNNFGLEGASLGRNMHRAFGISCSIIRGRTPIIDEWWAQNSRASICFSPSSFVRMLGMQMRFELYNSRLFISI